MTYFYIVVEYYLIGPVNKKGAFMNEGKKSADAMAEDIRRGDYSDFKRLLHLCAYIPKDSLEEAIKQGYEKEDIYQESVIAFLHALHTYDKTRGAGFCTYASVCIKNHILSLLRSGRRQKNVALVDYISIEDADLISESDPEEEWIEKEELMDMKKQILSVLSAFEGEVLKLYLKGFSHKSIGEKLGRTEKSVGNAISRIRKKLRTEL